MSEDRVRRNSPESVNKEIDKEMRDRIKKYKKLDPSAIEARLKELNKEWDVERNIEVIAPSLILGGVTLAALFSKKWLLLPGLVAAFLLQHGIQGWCPPVSILRAKKVRTKEEIEKEKYILRAARGDFDHVEDRTAGELVKSFSKY